jgi:hypothetical protein
MLAYYSIGALGCISAAFPIFHREEQLQLQLEIHKEAIYDLHAMNQKLRADLK